ncbi:LysR family transcriptional regulator [Bifidobacterium simiarum]|uniref:HTH lysR-type domain-containing protein n=1 Tax=Bifidobacterium simiarum TaxID=2045441 RepID=A0A2M9HE59_9BIFI|nr:LysR family transcriptional regulator [Bifidobacterium simiarum]MBT1167139.1 LysR family transcriptional regulator [Bifidobacterium simiarum]PJM75113.1 hypothetical protein CSQ87_05795 [Bifidobacterium simiarum]
MASIDNIRDLELFQLVAELGSFTGAAAAAGVTQPTVSQAVKRLERRLGATLVERRRFGAGGEARLTRAGLVLVRHTAAILSEIESIPADLAAAGVGDVGGVGSDVARYHVGLPPIIAAYLLGCDSIDSLTDVLSSRLGGDVAVQSVGSGTLRHRIERHAVDFGAVASVDRNPTFGDARAFRIASFPFVFVRSRVNGVPAAGGAMAAGAAVAVGSGAASFGGGAASVSTSASAFAGADAIDLNDDRLMAGLRFVTLTDEFVHSKAANEFVRSHVDPTRIIEVADVETMKSIIASGIAVGIMASVAVEGDPRFTVMPVRGATLPTFDVYVFDDVVESEDVRTHAAMQAFLNLVGSRRG